MLSKMKMRRKFTALMTVCMLFASMPIVATAETNEVTDDNLIYGNVVSQEVLDDGTVATTYEFDLDSDDSDNPGGYRSLALDQTFTMTSNYHRGGDRAFSGNKLSYSFAITDENGNAVNATVGIEMWDYYHEYALRTHGIPADGSMYGYTNMTIVPYRYYYFKYYKSTTTNLKIRVIIYTWTE